jgi:hypothetical protein
VLFHYLSRSFIFSKSDELGMSESIRLCPFWRTNPLIDSSGGNEVHRGPSPLFQEVDF